MRTNRTSHARSSASYRAGMLLAAFTVLTGILGGLYSAGVLRNPWVVAEDPFQVRIPINALAIPAYTRVNREDMLNPATGGLMYQRLPPQSIVGISAKYRGDGGLIESRVASVQRGVDGGVVCMIDGRSIRAEDLVELGGAVMNVNGIIGRVVRRDKRAGLAFREDTFFPQGTPEGIAGATPRGMRAVTLDASVLIGIHSLQAGDRLDLLASISSGRAVEAAAPGVVGLSPTGRGEEGSEETTAVLLARDAMVLRPVYVRNEASAVSSLTQGKRIQNEPHYEVAIAVNPDDVIRLQDAISKEMPITCVAHSMQASSVAAESNLDAPESLRSLTAPVTVRAIPAYAVVTREAFVDPATRRLRTQEVSPEEAERLGIETNVESILGTVTRHDIPPGSFLRAADLLKQRGPVTPMAGDTPEAAVPAASREDWRVVRLPLAAQEGAMDEATVVGDRPAITAFVPAGRTAFAIPWNRVYGAEHLQLEDHIDLLASWSLESDQEQEETETRPDGTRIVRRRSDQARRSTLRTQEDSLGYRSESWFVAADAIVIGPVGFPAPAAALRAIGGRVGEAAATGGATLSVHSGPPLLIAVEDRDVERVAAALAAKGTLFTAAYHAAVDTVPAGQRRIAVVAQDLMEFSEFSETVWLGNRRRPATRLVNIDDPGFAEALSPEELETYYGRILKAAKRREEIFRAEDFLPAGTASGYLADAAPGTVLMAVSDRLIGGLDAFVTGDRVAVVQRGRVPLVAGAVQHSPVQLGNEASVVAGDVRVASAARGGRVMLEVLSGSAARLQAALAEVSGVSGVAGEPGAATSLEAVGLPRASGVSDAAAVEDRFQGIPDFNPLDDAVMVESIVGGQRTWEIFGGTKRRAGDRR
ncbi:MAG: hypothetical protein ACKOEO_16985 [Planctomycetaceae bacterium]